MDPLDGLNPEQRRAAETVRGPVGKGRAKATVDGQLAVRGTLTFAVGSE